jgi:hypothetical protein
MKLRMFVPALAVLLAGCGTQAPAPSWRAGAADSLQRYSIAYLKGDARTEGVEFDRARSELASTGQPGMVARAELTRCAMQVASLVFEPCQGFERLRRDAPPAERAYADYIAGRATPADVPLVPEQHRAIAGGREDTATLQAIGDPVSRLVAAGVLLRSGRAAPQVVQVAVDTASQQGWRRPLLAWLGVQAQRAERAGHKDEAERIRRRMALVTEGH